MTQDGLWLNHYEQVMAYMRTKGHRPSKHKEEDAQMFNWVKYNKKLYHRGLLDDARKQKFEHLLAECTRLRRINQYAYVVPPKEFTTDAAKPAQCAVSSASSEHREPKTKEIK
ncbi:MAG: helicase associated domain-containing protein [Bacteroidales bacterium]|nr:helicase associated domain-containing protein [Bacteroidales bacterium]